MPDPWLAGAHRDPGRNAGYNSGRSQMVRTVAHYTVGSDSRNVGKDGYFHWLVHRDESREGGCTQYAEIDAVTWHGADAGNPYGPGVEFERLVTGGVNAEGLSDAQPLTQNQLNWGARIITFCEQWGIPAQLYDGARYGGGGWHGWINHHDIDSSRSDGLLRAEWDAMAGTTGELFTVGQMDDIAQWHRDTRKLILEQLIGEYQQGKYNGILATWEKDTRAIVGEMIAESEARILAAINGTSSRSD